MTRNFHGRLLWAIALLAATVVACGGEPDEPPSGPVATPTPVATATATATASPTATTEGTATPKPTATATAAATASPTVTAEATPLPTPTPAPTTTPTPAPSDPDATTFRYDTYDTTGAVSTAGSYAFLADADDPSTAVTTYEGLRDGTATALLIHTSDADGVSRAALYDAVEVGDLFEWHQADDCFVRYKVTEVKPDPGGTVPRKLLAVEWMIYAFTGCYGRVTPDTGIQFIWDELSELGGESLKAPVIVGVHQLVPENWMGALRDVAHDAAPGGSHLIQQANPSTAVLSALDYWREPKVPEGWSLAYISAGTSSDPYQGFSATYSPTEGGGISLEFSGYFLSHRNRQVPSGSTSSGVVVEARVIAGRPALIEYSPAGDNNYAHIPTTIAIMDLATESGYTLKAYNSTLKNIDTLIAIASSLFDDAPSDPDATTFRYDTYDTTGAVSTAGSYAFLADADDPATAVTTYEGLRDGTATALLIHTSDADGVSRAALYDTVEAGDLFEWHQADDCFVRYRVTEVKPDPTGDVPRKVLGVAWITYAYTGCSGSVTVSGERSITWAVPDIRFTNPSTVVMSPTRHGPWLLVPQEFWGSSSLEAYTLHPHADADGAGESALVPEVVPTKTSNEDVARGLPLWREPNLPTAWTLAAAEAGTSDAPLYGYTAYYKNARGYPAVEISTWYRALRPDYVAFYESDSGIIFEARVVDGRPALLLYSPKGTNHVPHFSTQVRIYDGTTGSEHYVIGRDPSLLGSNVEATLEIARSLFIDAPSDPDATTFRYDTYDMTGAVATAGSYAFLADADDPSTAVTTYEGLRDGTATALLIHTSDADGVSREGIYDAVEAGDLFEWHQADDCFVRYRVTDVPEAAAAATRREYGVRWETYVFQGCQTGSIPTSAAVTFTAAAELPLDHLGGTSLTDFAVVHGIMQLVPDGVLLPSGAIVAGSPVAVREPVEQELSAAARGVPTKQTSDLSEARRLPLWREPSLPVSWRFASVRSGNHADVYGYQASYVGPAGVPAVRIQGAYPVRWLAPRASSWTNSAGKLTVREIRVIAGRPATVQYSPLGTQHHATGRIKVEIFDPATGSGYIVSGLSGSLGLRGGPDALERVIAIAESLFAEPPPAAR